MYFARGCSLGVSEKPIKEDPGNEQQTSLCVTSEIGKCYWLTGFEKPSLPKFQQTRLADNINSRLTRLWDQYMRFC